MAEEKKRVCDLTRPYYSAAEQLTTRRGDTHAPHSLAEVKDRTVGTLPGSLAERILNREGAKVKTYEGGQDEIYADLRLGRTDAVLLDNPVTLYYGGIDPDLEIQPGSFGEVRYAAAVRKGEDDLREALDKALEELAREGTLRQLYERWGLWNAETAQLLGDTDAQLARRARAVRIVAGLGGQDAALPAPGARSATRPRSPCSCTGR